MKRGPVLRDTLGRETQRLRRLPGSQGLVPGSQLGWGPAGFQLFSLDIQLTQRASPGAPSSGQWGEDSVLQRHVKQTNVLARPVVPETDKQPQELPASWGKRAVIQRTATYFSRWSYFLACFLFSPKLLLSEKYPKQSACWGSPALGRSKSRLCCRVRSAAQSFLTLEHEKCTSRSSQGRKAKGQGSGDNSVGEHSVSKSKSLG